MRTWHRAAVVAAALLVTGSLTGAVARAATPGTLYVSGDSNCDDSGGGSQATPFCTIQAAADVVAPGQTVVIAAGFAYLGAVTLSRSGTPEQPITFEGSTPSIGTTEMPELHPGGDSVPLTLSGVHDVHVARLTLSGDLKDGVNVVGSHDVTLDQVYVSSSSAGGAVIDGASAAITVSRSVFENRSGYGVEVLPGATGITLTTNDIHQFGVDSAYFTAGIHVSGASAAITSNSILIKCHEGIAVDGVSTGEVVVENNFLSVVRTSAECGPAAVGLSVAADSVAQVRADYNALVAQSPGTEYSWGGTTYQNVAAFAAATGQGAHDVEVPSVPPLIGPPQEGSPLIDSADPTAPGELPYDLTGYRQIDDPLLPNMGGGYADRGAYEFRYELSNYVTVSPSDARGIVPFGLTVTVPHSEGVTCVVDWGDGSDPVINTTGTVSHTYTKPGFWVERTTATIAGDGTQSIPQTVTNALFAGTPTTPAASISTGPVRIAAPGGLDAIMPGSVQLSTSSLEAWEMSNRLFDFGDGTSTSMLAAVVGHQYAKSGTYQVYLEQSDIFGRTSSATGAAVAGDAFLPLDTGPVRVYDSRSTGHQVPSHGTAKLSLQDLGVAGSGVEAATVTVTVTRATKPGYIGVFPDGGAAGTTSNVNFSAGQTIANEVNAVAGANGIVDFYNGSDAPVDLIVDSFGKQERGQIGHTYSPVGPVRVLDTRNGTGAVKGVVSGNGLVTFQVAGKYGVPANAAAVVLNVLATHTQSAGYILAYGDGGSRPGTSNGNWAAGQTISNLVVVPLHNGKVTLVNGGAGTADFAADLVGCYNDYGTASLFVPSSPTRLLDTRSGTGTGHVAKLGAGQSLRLQIAGVSGIPAPVSAVAVNLTAVHGTAAGYLTAWPDGTPRSTTSSLNFAAGQVVANMAITPVGADGAIDIYNGSSAAVDVIVDAYGSYYSYPVQ